MSFLLKDETDQDITDKLLISQYASVLLLSFYVETVTMTPICLGDVVRMHVFVCVCMCASMVVSVLVNVRVCF